MRVISKWSVHETQVLQALPIPEVDFSMVFQPIANLEAGGIFGYEALMRPATGIGPLELIARARALDRASELELDCCLMAIRGFSCLNLEGRLFLNLSTSALVSTREMHTSLAANALKSGIPPGRIVIELGEHDLVADWDLLSRTLTSLRQLGFGLALDDFGEGYSGLRRWIELRPDFLKIDQYFIRNLHESAAKFAAMRSLVSLSDSLETQLIAEGVESGAELSLVRDLGISMAQGYFIGRPDAQPALELPAAVNELVLSKQIAVFPSANQVRMRYHTAGTLLVSAPVAQENWTNLELADLFAQHPLLHALAVVSEGIPVGLVNRHDFMDRLAQPYYREIFGRRSCTTFMNASPLVVEADMSIESLTAVLTRDDQRYLAEGFVIVENGRYLGLGTGEALVRAVAELRIEAARHANPLTFLPGNIPISEHIARLLASGATFAAAYCDLDQFKPFNDQYGYWKGDEMIKLCARTIASHCDPLVDFLGHVGGDDFVVLFQSADWRERCNAIVADFARGARGLYNEADLARGGIDAEDRQGNPMFFGFTTLSIGALPSQPGRYRNAEEVASAAAAAKRVAKKAKCGVVVVE
jgi:diguanylate cyclase (GGDEF)-like protein